MVVHVNDPPQTMGLRVKRECDRAVACIDDIAALLRSDLSNGEVFAKLQFRLKRYHDGE